MGLDIHGINFLRYAAQRQRFGAVATLGRQEVQINNRKLALFFQLKRSYGPYCERLLLDFFGATKVDSFDNSDYENATHVADMNLPMPKDQFPQYDTIIDGGTLEHIYNVPQALKNLSHLCREGGQIIHISPANNECGHGFWQFSPELFYSLYSQENGYSQTNVFMACKDNEHYWYEVKKPSNGERVYIQSLAPLFVLCRTHKVSSHFSHAKVQQSDYAYVWKANKEVAAKEPQPKVNKPIQGPPEGQILTYVKEILSHLRGLRSPLILAILRSVNSIFLSKTSVSERNPYLTKRSVAELVK
jgi:hypothetical protein